MPYSFQPKILLSIVCLILLFVFSSLGIWQLQRAHDKEVMQSDLEALAELPPLKIDNDSRKLTPGIRASAKGSYLIQDQFLLDNIIHKGKPGYYLITPFKFSESHEIILVNRGWLQKTSQGLPQAATPEGVISIQGVLANPRSKPVILGNIDHPISDTPPLWYYMDVEIFEQQSKYKVLPLVLRLDPDSNSDFVRNWPKYEAKTGMHIGYAIQWFVFAFFVLIALVGLNFKRSTASESNNK